VCAAAFGDAASCDHDRHAITGSLLFNFTNGNGQLLRERFTGIIEDPATLGLMLAAVYAVASLAQIVVGRLIDRYPLKRIYVGIVVLQAPLLLLAANAQGWTLFFLQIAIMVSIFGAIPFTDAMVVATSMTACARGCRASDHGVVRGQLDGGLGARADREASGFQWLMLMAASRR
jgi:MFS family permease